jgi:hypothetical protein
MGSIPAITPYFGHSVQKSDTDFLLGRLMLHLGNASSSVRFPKGVAGQCLREIGGSGAARLPLWRDDDYDVRENGTVIGRIFSVPSAAPGPGCGREAARQRTALRPRARPRYD